VLGTIIPMLFMIGLAIDWVSQGKPIAVPLTTHHFFSSITQAHNLPFFVIVLFSLMGFEMSAVHAEEVKNPQRDFPRALLYSSSIILITLVATSTAIAFVVPQKMLGIVSGIDQALTIFLNTFHLHWLLPIVITLIVLGAFGSMAAWVIGPTKALAIAAEDKCAPKIFANRTRKNVPVAVLVLQWVVVTILCCLFLFFKDISTWYWILSVLTAQLALLFYIILFAAAIRLRYKTPPNPKAYRIPGGNIGIWIVGCMGIFACVSVIVLGFIPPDTINIPNTGVYEGLLIGGILIFTLIPLLIKGRK